jgi:hypothetical protein
MSMTMTLRSAASALFGVPPMASFFRKAPTRVSRVEPVMRAPESPVPAGVDMDRILQAARAKPVNLDIIEWAAEAPAGANETVVAEAPAAPAEATADTHSRRIRERYLSARFPGVVHKIADLESPARVVKAARLYFEDGELEMAIELLDAAIQQNSRAESVWLAELEILFLARDAARFVECARAFRALHAGSAAWGEVARLGAALAPTEAMFVSGAFATSHAHYGPWPDLPNWIQANWDLTAEIIAGDFHRSMRRAAPRIAA